MGGLFESLTGALLGALLVFVQIAMWFVATWVLLVSVGAVINDLILLWRRQWRNGLNLFRDALPLMALFIILWLLRLDRPAEDRLVMSILGMALMLWAWRIGPGHKWAASQANREK